MNRTIGYLFHYINGTTADDLIYKLFCKIYFLHNYFFKRSSTETSRAFAILWIVSMVGLGLSSNSILTTVLSDKSASLESLSCESPLSCRYRLMFLPIVDIVDYNVWKVI